MIKIPGSRHSYDRCAVKGYGQWSAIKPNKIIKLLQKVQKKD